MKKNVIVLTNGLAGSSVLTGLLSRGGYWLGDKTFSKEDYNTYENNELVELNKRIFASANYNGNYEMIFEPGDISFFSDARKTVDPEPYKVFLDKCNANTPWLWKDPRLWLTIHYWVDLLDLDNIDFVLLTREPLQTWISTTIRRQIQTPAYCKNYMYGIRDSIREFLGSHDKTYLELVYEELILQPENTIAALNSHLGCELQLEDLQSVFSGQLGKRQRGAGDFLKASAIYLKNYSQRYR